MGLDLAEQRLANDAKRLGNRCDALAAFDQPYRLLLELERVSSHQYLRHFRSPCLN